LPSLSRVVLQLSLLHGTQKGQFRDTLIPLPISLPSRLPLFLIFPSIKHISVCGRFKV
jgi:hypothetical protein